MSLERTPWRDKLWKTNQDLKASLGTTPFIPLLDNFCYDQVCPLLTKDGKNVHFDWGHLTAWGAAEVIADSREEIVAAVQGHTGKQVVRIERPKKTKSVAWVPPPFHLELPHTSLQQTRKTRRGKATSAIIAIRAARS